MSMEDEDPANVPNIELDPYVERELLATIDGLGGVIDADSTSLYTKGEDCTECLSDLLRCLRREDKETRIFSFYLGKFRVVSENLIPLLKTYRNEQHIVTAVVKLMAQLTMPISPESQLRENHLRYFQETKDAIISSELVGLLMTFLADPLVRREHKDDVWIELILTLWRNLLLIPDAEPTAAAGNNHLTHMHSDLLQAFDKEGVLDLIVLLTQEVDGENSAWSLLLLEIVQLVLGRESPSRLWTEFINTTKVIRKQFPNASEEELQGELAARARMVVKKTVGTSELSSILEEERRKKTINSPLRPTRHPRFGGVFRQTDSLGSVQVLNVSAAEVVDEQLGSALRLKREGVKPSKGVRVKKYRQEVEYESSFELRLVLKNFADKFLKADCYNKLMEVALKDLASDKKVLSDDLAYFWLVGFFTEFSRLSWKYKHFTEKAPVLFGSKATFEEKSESSSLDLDENQKPKNKAKDSAEDKENQEENSNDLFNELLQDINKENEEKKKKEEEAKRKDEEKKEEDDINDVIMGDPKEQAEKQEGEEKEEKEEKDKPKKAKDAKKKEDRYEMVSPVGTTLDFESFVRVSKHLKNYIEDKNWEALPAPVSALKEMLNTVAAMWEEPATNSIAQKLLANVIYRQDDFMMLLITLVKNYDPTSLPKGYFANLVAAVHIMLKLIETYMARFNNRVYIRSKPSRRGDKTGFALDDAMEGGSSDEEDDDDDSKYEQEPLDFFKLVRQLAHNTTIKNYCYLLASYHTNSPATNHHIVKLFSRFAFDYREEFSALFHRQKVLNLFITIMGDNSIKPKPRAAPLQEVGQVRRRKDRLSPKETAFAEILKLINHIITDFVQLASDKPFMWLELLFYKSRAEVCFSSSRNYQVLSGDRDPDADFVVDKKGDDGGLLHGDGDRSANREKGSKRNVGERAMPDPWTKEEDTEIEERLSLFKDLPKDQLFDFLAEGTKRSHLEIGRRLVELKLMAEEKFKEYFPNRPVSKKPPSSTTATKKKEQEKNKEVAKSSKSTTTKTATTATKKTTTIRRGRLVKQSQTGEEEKEENLDDIFGGGDDDKDSNVSQLTPLEEDEDENEASDDEQEKEKGKEKEDSSEDEDEEEKEREREREKKLKAQQQKKKQSAVAASPARSSSSTKTSTTPVSPSNRSPARRSDRRRSDTSWDWEKEKQKALETAAIIKAKRNDYESSDSEDKSSSDSDSSDSEDEEEKRMLDFLNMKVGKLLDTSDGRPALDWLKKKLQICIEERLERRDQNLKTQDHIVEAKDNKEKNNEEEGDEVVDEFLLLQNVWLVRIITELGFPVGRSKKRFTIPKEVDTQKLVKNLELLEEIEGRVDPEIARKGKDRKSVLEDLRKKRKDFKQAVAAAKVEEDKERKEEEEESDSSSSSEDEKEKSKKKEAEKKRKEKEKAKKKKEKEKKKKEKAKKKKEKAKKKKEKEEKERKKKEEEKKKQKAAEEKEKQRKAKEKEEREKEKEKEAEKEKEKASTPNAARPRRVAKRKHKIAEGSNNEQEKGKEKEEEKEKEGTTTTTPTKKRFAKRKRSTGGVSDVVSPRKTEQQQVEQHNTPDNTPKRKRLRRAAPEGASVDEKEDHEEDKDNKENEEDLFA